MVTEAERVVRWKSDFNEEHSMSIPQAAAELKDLYDDFPGGFDQVLQTIRALRKQNADAVKILQS